MLLVLPETDTASVKSLVEKIRGALVREAFGSDESSVALAWTTWQRGDDLNGLISRVTVAKPAVVMNLATVN